MIYIDDPDFTLYHGDVLEQLRNLPDGSVHCCVTSPPYWGLRDYGAEGQIGLEDTPDAFVAKMVEVFREVRRVLRDDGTCWINLGDSYAASGGDDRSGSSDGSVGRGDRPDQRRRAGLKQKDLVGIPWRVAFALQQDGWWLRSDIIWSKPNPMPESVTDRPTKAHEYLFLLTKSQRYFFDADAVREPFAPASEDRYRYAFGGAKSQALADANKTGVGVGTRPIGMRTFPGQPAEAERGPDGRRKTSVQGADGSIQHRDGERWPNGGRNVRSVWEIATQPYADAHFATFPQELPRRCIAAGTSERGCCPECGAPWEREVERITTKQGEAYDSRMERAGDDFTPLNQPNRAAAQVPTRYNLSQSAARTTGWQPSCDHGHDPVPCTVLDPFMGSGTTAYVARALGRRSIGVELNADYCQLIAKRMQQLSLLGDVA